MRCPICKIEEIKEKPTGIQDLIIECPICGDYLITHEAQYEIDSVLTERKHLLSGVIREYNLDNPGSTFNITPDNMEQLVKSVPPSQVSEKIDRLLLNFEKMCLHVGDKLVINIEKDYPLAYSENSIEFDFYIKYLMDTGLIEHMDMIGGIRRITIDGWKRIQDIKKPSSLSDKAFVAMNFDNDLKYIYDEGIEPAITKLGYKQPFRVDLKEYTGKIDDKILADIKESRFVVADFTGQKHGVYFEAGYALGLNIPVIWTCKSDETKELHFDTRQYNHIAWKDTADLHKRLFDRIRHLIGRYK